MGMFQTRPFLIRLIIFAITFIVAGGLVGQCFAGTVKDDAAAWKIYRNEKYGFEVKYPQNFLTGEKEEKTSKISDMFGVFWVGFIDEKWGEGNNPAVRRCAAASPVAPSNRAGSRSPRLSSPAGSGPCW